MCAEIPLVCPCCGAKLHHNNAVDLCGLYFVTCSSRFGCRWCLLLEFEGYGNFWSKS